MAATTSQPAVSADFPRAGKTSGPVSAVSLSLCRASSGSSHPRSGDDPHGPGHGVRVSDWGARVSAQPTAPIFSAAIVPAARSTSRPADAAAVSGFAAPPAIRRCVGSSRANDAGGIVAAGRANAAARLLPPDRPLVSQKSHRPHARVNFHCPQKEEGAGGFRHHTGPPASFLRSPKRRQGDGFIPRWSGRSCAPR
jgi:hypothetical protein